MPCNLVRMLQLGVRRDVPNFSGLRVQEEKLCQPEVWMTKTAMMPFKLIQASLAKGRCWFSTQSSQ
eukprot:2746586-Pleurochrysis_carterae.AAC.1